MSVVRIQSVHTYFLTLHVCGMSWQGFWLNVQNFSLQLIALLDIKSPASYFSNTSFVDHWLVCIIFIVSAFIDPKNYSWVWLQIVSGPYPNRTYIFYSPAGLWKAMTRGPVFVISPVVINKFIGFKEFPQFLQVLSCLRKCWPKGNQGAPSIIGLITCKCFVLHIKVVCFIFVLVNIFLFYSRSKGNKGPLG